MWEGDKEAEAAGVRGVGGHLAYSLSCSKVVRPCIDYFSFFSWNMCDEASHSLRLINYLLVASS